MHKIPLHPCIYREMTCSTTVDATELYGGYLLYLPHSLLPISSYKLISLHLHSLSVTGIFVFTRAADKRTSLIKTTSLKRRTDRDLEGTVNESYQQGECMNIYHNAFT